MKPVVLRLHRSRYRPAAVQAMEAPSGIEPLNRSFADCSLNHLGTAPRTAL